MTIATTTLSRQRPPDLGPHPAGAISLILAGLHVGGLVVAESAPIWASVAAAVLAVATAVWFVSQTWRARGEATRFWELQNVAAVVTAAVLVARTAELFGQPAYPLVYLCLALIGAFQSRTAAVVAVGWVLGMEWGAYLLGGWADILSLEIVVLHSVFAAVFGLLALLVHGAELLERRRRYRIEVAEERENLLRQAHEFRLMSSSRNERPKSRAEAAELIRRDAVDAVNESIYVSLSLLKTGLRCHTCVLLWMDVKNEQLRIKELVSDSDEIRELPINPAAGVVGGITRRREPVRLDDLRSGFRGLSYYRQAPDVSHFAGVPVLENGHLRGVLCVDRLDGEPFDDSDVAVVSDTADHIVRSIENERVFASIEKSKYELGRFLESSRRLNDVLTPQQVYRVALECARDVAPYELAAITLFDEGSELHEVVAIDHAHDYECEADEWEELTFHENSGLVSMVVKNQHYLPYGGTLRDGPTVLFTRDEELENLSSMLVLPLNVHDETIGTFVVAHREPGRYPAQRREMLEVVCNQVAVALQNARLYAQMEQMATTDGLTGLANHRSFQSKLEETIARHRRQEREFCLLLTDIDHFKSVNDTHGHPVGDEVLRQTSACFRETLRETDTPCRYGGEEFSIILEETDVEGARVIADRLRTELKKLVFHSDEGPFSVTMSIGISHWPGDAEHKQKLIDLADRALYHSKGSGRDCVTAHTDVAPADARSAS